VRIISLHVDTNPSVILHAAIAPPVGRLEVFAHTETADIESLAVAVEATPASLNLDTNLDTTWTQNRAALALFADLGVANPAESTALSEVFKSRLLSCHSRRTDSKRSYATGQRFLGSRVLPGGGKVYGGRVPILQRKGLCPEEYG
jgi:hypothetical protein